MIVKTAFAVPMTFYDQGRSKGKSSEGEIGSKQTKGRKDKVNQGSDQISKVKRRDKLKVLYYTNSRSIKNIIALLTSVVSAQKVDIVAITESWLDNDSHVGQNILTGCAVRGV